MASSGAACRGPGADDKQVRIECLKWSLGQTVGRGRLLCAMFRHMFPEFMHDVLWNHALCEIRQRLEDRLNDGRPVPAD